MKDIVVAIDFSKGSIHALEYAIELANLIHANINLVWVDNISSNEVTFANEAKDLHNETKELRDEAKGNLTICLQNIKVDCYAGNSLLKFAKARFIRNLQIILPRLIAAC